MRDDIHTITMQFSYQMVEDCKVCYGFDMLEAVKLHLLSFQREIIKDDATITFNIEKHNSSTAHESLYLVMGRKEDTAKLTTDVE